MRRYKLTERNIDTVNGMLRKFAKSCILKHELLVSIRTPEKPNEPFSRRIPKLPENFRDWEIGEIGDVVQFYGGNKVIIIRGRTHMELRRAPFKFAEHPFSGDHIFVTAIKKKKRDTHPSIPAPDFSFDFDGDYEGRDTYGGDSLMDVTGKLLMYANRDDIPISVDTVLHAVTKSHEVMHIDTV